MRTLRRPMFKIGGKAEAGNDGIMSGLTDREQLQAGTKIEPFSALTADTYGSPYYDNQVSMDNLRRFRDLGMSNPYKELSGRAGFNTIGDYLTRPAEKSIFGKIKEASPKVQEERASASSGEQNIELNPFKNIIRKDDELYNIPKNNNDNGNGDSNGSNGSNVVTQAEKNDLLKARAKEFEELLNPGARKRVINNALAAASKAAGDSAGKTTLQTIADMVTAGAGATSEIDKTKQKAAELAIGESIQKGIYASKPKTKNAVETMMALIAKGKRSEDNPEGRTDDEESYFQANIKGKSSEDRFLDIETNLGRSRAVADKYKDDKNFAGVLPFNKKDQKEFINNAPLGSVVYMNPPKDSLYEIIEKDGKKELQFLSKEKG